MDEVSSLLLSVFEKRSMYYASYISCVVCVLLLLSPIACAHSADSPTAPALQSSQAHPIKVAETKAVLRDLWLGHVLSIRNVAVATMDKNAWREA